MVSLQCVFLPLALIHLSLCFCLDDGFILQNDFCMLYDVILYIFMFLLLIPTPTFSQSVDSFEVMFLNPSPLSMVFLFIL